MFEETETDASTGDLINVRAMPLPKNFASSSATPKSTLQTLAVKLDRFSLVDYTPLSGSFRAARVALKIRWGTGRQQEWRMDDIGCWTIAEAENYVATLALHELNAVEGRGERGMWRLLPPLFRDLWDELEEKRKETVDKERRATWAMLRGIFEARLAASEDPDAKVCRHPNIFRSLCRSLTRCLSRMVFCSRPSRPRS